MLFNIISYISISIVLIILSRVIVLNMWITYEYLVSSKKINKKIFMYINMVICLICLIYFIYIGFYLGSNFTSLFKNQESSFLSIIKGLCPPLFYQLHNFIKFYLHYHILFILSTLNSAILIRDINFIKFINKLGYNDLIVFLSCNISIIFISIFFR